MKKRTVAIPLISSQNFKFVNLFFNITSKLLCGYRL